MENDLKLWSLKEIEEDRESKNIAQKYENITNKPSCQNSCNTSDEKLISIKKPEKKRKLKKKKENKKKEEKNVLSEIVGFLPMKKRKEAIDYVNALVKNENIKIKNNKIYLKGKNVGHLTALLASNFLPRNKKLESLLSFATPPNEESAKVTPKFEGLLNLSLS